MDEEEFEFTEDIRWKLLLKEQEKLASQFIDNDEACLYCESGDLSEDELEYMDQGVRSCVVRCNSCGRSWTACYELIGIETDELWEKGKALMDEETGGEVL